MTIWTAAKQGDLELVQQLVSEGAPIDSRRDGDVTPLHAAASEGHVPVIEWLIEGGAQVDARTEFVRDESGTETPLFLAVLNGHLNAVDALLKRGANPDLKSSDGSNPLDVAAAHGDLSIVKLLVESGAKINCRGSANPLCSALCGHHLDIARYLLANGARPEAKLPPAGESLLHILAGAKWLPGVDFALILGLDVNDQDKDGNTPLHNAVLSYGVTVYESVSLGARTKTVVTEKPEDTLPIVKRLLDAGASVTVQDSNGLSPIDYARKIRAQPLIDLLSVERPISSE